MQILHLITIIWRCSYNQSFTALENLITFVTLSNNDETDVISKVADAENVLYDHIVTAKNTVTNVYIPKRKKEFLQVLVGRGNEFTKR